MAHTVADPGFLERGWGTSRIRGGVLVWIGGARSDGTSICGQKLKKMA